MDKEQTSAKLFNACLKAIREMGVSEFKKASWFGWKKSEAQLAASPIVEKKAA